MKKFFKWFGIIVGSLLLLIIITLIALVMRMNSRMNKTYEIAVEKIAIPTDSASIAGGKRWFPLCQSCHGEALQGKVFFSDPKIGTIYSPNLTRGKGGIGADYTDEDWIRSIRHGVGPSGKPLFVMPAKDLQHLSKEHIGQLVAFLKQIPPVDNSKGKNELPAFTKILMQMGAFGVILSAEVVDHKAAFPVSPAEGTSPDWGKYIVTISGCAECHGTDYAGGKSPDPNSPPVPNITPGGNLGKWSDQDFIQTLRMGVTPEKKVLNDSFMPWKHLGQFSDKDLSAVVHFLQSLPKKETPKS